MNIRAFSLLASITVSFAAVAAEEAPQPISPGMHHFRDGNPREWTDFPETPDAAALSVTFEAKPNDQAWTLQLRQQNVKIRWDVLLNGTTLGPLTRDENDMLRLFDVPPDALRKGRNELVVQCRRGDRDAPDDIRVGEILLHPKPRAKLLSESALAVTVRDVSQDRLTPARITIVRSDGALPVLGTESDGPLAVRAGVVYTATGEARVMLPAGDYTVYAGRGFEYSLAKAPVSLEPGKMAALDLAIRREVPTEGYLACDTHIHTVTHSGHGDCSMAERMITLAGEGVELPVSTDHNVQISYDAAVEDAGVDNYFTPVVGNEVTTKLGHFNVFPLQTTAPVPDFKANSWAKIFASIKDATDARVIILNHARDIHSGTRPFGPRLYNAAVGANVEGWVLEANGMEVINSGATQTDALQLLHDWMTQLNYGNDLTPVGCSDSHDVNRYIVGQGRTYIRTDDSTPGEIDVDEAVGAFLRGEVLVSYGLLVDMTIDQQARVGEMHRPKPEVEEVAVGIRVLGPHWATADTVRLYANGEVIREESITRQGGMPRGIIWQGQWLVPAPEHDVHLVAVATGPGITKPWWPLARPYQPTAPDFTPTAWGSTGAIWLDGDGDGKRSTARDYAETCVAHADGDVARLVAALASYDVAVAIQAAHRWHQAGHGINAQQLTDAPIVVREGFRRYQAAAAKSAVASN